LRRLLIRIVTSGPTQKRANELLENLKAPFAQYDDPKGNHLKFHEVGWWNMQAFLREFTYRTFNTSIAMPLSLAEITSIFHFTAEKVTTWNYARYQQIRRDETPVKFAAPDRLRHCYVIGQTGTGKTGFSKT
jgi:hypothetical protein